MENAWGNRVGGDNLSCDLRDDENLGEDRASQREQQGQGEVGTSIERLGMKRND